MLLESLSSLDPAKVAETLSETGYVAIERALNVAAIDQIVADVRDLKFAINENLPPIVMTKTQVYANHFLAQSKTAFDFVTSGVVTSVCRAALGPQFRMAGKRIYETRSSNYMQFHSDVGAVCDDPRRVDAAVFITYLNDVEDGEFEVIEGSHLWGTNIVGSKENDDTLLAQHADKVRGFKMPKGSLLIYNGRLLHRARQISDQSFARRSLFFQVNRGTTQGEPVIVDVSFIDERMSDDAKMLLGFGARPSQAPFPVSKGHHLPLQTDGALREYFAKIGLVPRASVQAVAPPPPPPPKRGWLGKSLERLGVTH